LHEGKVVGSKLVLVRRTAFLDSVEEALDPLVVVVELRAEAYRIVAIALGRDIGPMRLRVSVKSVQAASRAPSRRRITGQVQSAEMFRCRLKMQSQAPCAEVWRHGGIAIMQELCQK
jgi:hypothetical protein